MGLGPLHLQFNWHLYNIKLSNQEHGISVVSQWSLTFVCLQEITWIHNIVGCCPPFQADTPLPVAESCWFSRCFALILQLSGKGVSEADPKQSTHISTLLSQISASFIHKGDQIIVYLYVLPRALKCLFFVNIAEI